MIRPSTRSAVAWILPAGVLLAGLALVDPATAGVFTPESDSGSPNAVEIDKLYKIVLYIAIPIFLLVEGTLIWALVKFRARRGGSAPEQIRGNTPLEVGWTLGAAVILFLIATITFVFLGDIKNPERSDRGSLSSRPDQYASVEQPSPPGGEGLEVSVNMQQYLFRYDYVGERPLPGGRPVSSYYELVVPVGATVLLEVTSSDVVHSWWVPDLGGKVDGVPGHTNETWFKVARPGVFYGQCAELCGANHADMRTRVRVVSGASYRRWFDQQRRELVEAGEELARSRRDRRGR